MQSLQRRTSAECIAICLRYSVVLTGARTLGSLTTMHEVPPACLTAFPPMARFVTAHWPQNAVAQQVNASRHFVSDPANTGLPIDRNNAGINADPRLRQAAWDDFDGHRNYSAREPVRKAPLCAEYNLPVTKAAVTEGGIPPAMQNTPAVDSGRHHWPRGNTTSRLCGRTATQLRQFQECS